ncbi:hypothetical protein NQZ68_026316 [Dissostichus eleginoides]|nr:hypothetical protein NQZ68_026316 [Dissostichus eleginoides]
MLVYQLHQKDHAGVPAFPCWSCWCTSFPMLVLLVYQLHQQDYAGRTARPAWESWYTSKTGMGKLVHQQDQHGKAGTPARLAWESWYTSKTSMGKLILSLSLAALNSSQETVSVNAEQPASPSKENRLRKSTCRFLEHSLLLLSLKVRQLIQSHALFKGRRGRSGLTGGGTVHLNVLLHHSRSAALIRASWILTPP